MQHYIYILIFLFLISCGETTSKSIDTDSSKFKTLNEKISVLEKYVNFRNTYSSLEYKLTVHDNSGGLVPGPSDYYVAIYAKVLQSDVKLMLAGKSKSEAAVDLSWVSNIPNTKGLNPEESFTWYTQGKVILGVNDNNEVLYFNSSY